MQMVLLALEANMLEQLILNVQNLEDLLACDAIRDRLELNEHWQVLDGLFQSHPILKEVFHPIHPLTHHPLANADVHYNTVVRVGDVYEALSNVEPDELIQEKNIITTDADATLAASARLDFNQLQSFYYHAADQNLVIVAVRGKDLFSTSYF
jgi:hypothetical protein